MAPIMGQRGQGIEDCVPAIYPKIRSLKNRAYEEE